MDFSKRFLNTSKQHHFTFKYVFTFVLLKRSGIQPLRKRTTRKRNPFCAKRFSISRGVKVLESPSKRPALLTWSYPKTRTSGLAFATPLNMLFMSPNTTLSTILSDQNHFQPPRSLKKRRRFFALSTVESLATRTVKWLP